MVDKNYDIDNSLDRVWKEFGKQTQAGKLLYDLYGVRYRPEKFVNYPKLVLKPKIIEERPASTSKIKTAIQKISYPEVSLRKNYESKFNKVDMIPRRKKESVIKQDLNQIKESIINTNNLKKPFTNRKNQIESLQDNFMFQERTVMPKGARLPGVKIITDLPSEKPYQMTKKEELHLLYKQIIKEIDERYAHMDELKKLGKNKDQIIMFEIKERLEELKKIKQMIGEEI